MSRLSKKSQPSRLLLEWISFVAKFWNKAKFNLMSVHKTEHTQSFSNWVSTNSVIHNQCNIHEGETFNPLGEVKDTIMGVQGKPQNTTCIFLILHYNVTRMSLSYVNGNKDIRVQITTHSTVYKTIHIYTCMIIHRVFPLIWCTCHHSDNMPSSILDMIIEWSLLRNNESQSLKSW